MATVPSQIRKPDTSAVEIKVSNYDQVASLLVALLIMVGIAVGIMFIIWLTIVLVFVSHSVPIKLIENVPGRGDHAEGFERDLLAPGMEEMPELAEPQVEATIEAMTDAVANVAASMDVVSTPSNVTSDGDGGQGDRRPPGPLVEGDNIIPRWERWEIRFESSNRRAYATQLDSFKIELGAAGRGKKNVDYAYNLVKGRPDTRTGPGNKEDRLYMTWRGGNLEKFDRQILASAGIDVRPGRLLMQFYPELVEETLAEIEMENANGKTVQEFLKTVFGVKKTRQGYEFFVMEQRFRPEPR